jgi:hypothetical protein
MTEDANSMRPVIQLSLAGEDSFLIFNRKDTPLNPLLEQIVRAEAGGPGRKPLLIVVDDEEGRITVRGNAMEISDYNLRVLKREEELSNAYVELARKLRGEKKE